MQLKTIVFADMRRIGFLVVLFSAVALMGCDDGPDIRDLVKRMVVRTVYAENINFAGYSTFALVPDTLGLVSNATDDTIVTGNYAKTVVARIRSRMAETGYASVDKTAAPDLGINAYILDNQGIYQTYNYPSLGLYPGSYYSGFYGYGGYGYGGYYGYPSVQTFSYQSGTLVVELLDLKNPTPDNKYPVVWSVTIGDVYTSPDPLSKSLEAIDQAFNQSPYLGK